MADNMIQILEGFDATGCEGCGSVNGAALWGLGAPPATTSTAVKVAVGAAVLFFLVLPMLRGRRRGGRRGLGGMNPTGRAYGATIPR